MSDSEIKNKGLRFLGIGLQTNKERIANNYYSYLILKLKDWSIHSDIYS